MIRSVVSDADVAKTIELREAVDPLTATTVGDQRVFRAQASGWLQLLVADAGYGFAARFPDESTPVADVGVVPGRRGRGIGRALFAAVSAHARERGWDALHALFVEALEDVPGALAEEAPELDAWLLWQEAPSRRGDFLVIALEDGGPIGYAQLHVYPRVGYHGFTAVARSHRRRGVARALKEELIGRSRAEGLARLITQSNEANVGMRALNEALGYRPAPPLVVFRGTPA